jgi:hypothetical protein
MPKNGIRWIWKAVLEDYDCKLSFCRAGKTLAIATVGRDVEGLESELAMQRGLV